MDSMDPWMCAAPVAQALMGLAQRGEHGCLHARSQGRRARVRVSAGRLVSVHGVGRQLLGDRLQAAGALDADRHRAAYEHRPPRGPVGRWLVDVGAASRDAVDGALREQSAARLAELLGWPRCLVRFEPETVEPEIVEEDGVDLLTVLWRAVLTHVEAGQDAVPARADGRLTASGRRLVRALSRRQLLDSAQTSACVQGAIDDPRLRTALQCMGALKADQHGDGYSLLVQKRRQLAAASTPQQLLDLPPGAGPLQARRSLRRLARRLHPDRFEQDPPGVREASGQVMQALSRAASRVR